MIKSFFRKNYKYFLFILFIFIVDRLSKNYVILLDQSSLESDLLFFSSFFNIQLVWNSGVAFGLFSFEEDFYYNLITLIIIFVVILVIYLAKNANKLDRYLYSMIIGGASGNLLDRLFYRSVPDFIDLHYNNFHWFIFNVADIFITIGIISLIFSDILKNKKK
ncbi:signal peptidase II [Candidatus Pelagibacter sp.]|nr:signal peptidase II [Candidatus Pelagibacter sp.]